MNVPALTAFSSTKSIDIVQAEYLYRENKVFPVTKRDIEKKEYEGAFVFQPVPGIYNNVYCLDYASLYPTTMRQFNISPDTLLFKDKNHVPKDNEIKCTNGCVYTNEFEGFIPKILTDYFAKRKEYKKKMVAAQKEKYELIHILEKREKAAGIK
jgi:DNA polymerase elongation subunit (family B)